MFPFSICLDSGQGRGMLTLCWAPSESPTLRDVRMMLIEMRDREAALHAQSQSLTVAQHIVGLCYLPECLRCGWLSGPQRVVLKGKFPVPRARRVNILRHRPRFRAGSAVCCLVVSRSFDVPAINQGCGGQGGATLRSPGREPSVGSMVD